MTMTDPTSATNTQSAEEANPQTNFERYLAGEDVPPGEHPLEVAARSGFGPLSPMAKQFWHGEAVPCASCGQLAHRDDQECPLCGQDLSPSMLEKMRVSAGPWYVMEHIRPFPGVRLDLIIRQILRGVITETSIVRGPETDHQWRFAGETPGLCRYFDRCWNCHDSVSRDDLHCPVCLCYLDFTKSLPGKMAQPPRKRESVRPGLIGSGSSGDPVEELEALRSVLAEAGQTEIPTLDMDDTPRIGGIRATWLAAMVLVIVAVALILFSALRERQITQRRDAETRASVVLESQTC